MPNGLRICPKCDQPVEELDADAIRLKKGDEGGWRGFVLTCPHCTAILGAGFDPIALIEDTAMRVAAKLQEPPKN
ncbi:MAG: hypothetical protein C0621_10610 [Desulfuromonas sp.]|nr:MAG: hypothetical protein C0621_10610 [Desulfuromonas sp.]